ncbi:MAG: putative system TPR-repeat lipoprotein, partial [Pseudomonadota bacterium]
MKRSAISLKALPAALVLATLLTACGDDPAKLVAQAKDFQAKNDNAAAIIQLKNALQAADTPETRFLLGKSLLLTGDAVGAETEMRKALDAGYKADEVVPWLAKAALVQRKFKEVNELAGRSLTDPKAQADVLTTQATAWLAQGKGTEAARSVDAALKAKPDHAPALIEQARLKTRAKDYAGALAVLDPLAKGSEAAEEGLKLQGDIHLYGRNDVPAALEAYRASVKTKPDYAQGHAAVVRTLMRQGQLDEAGQALEALKKVAGGKPDTLYLQAQLAQQKKDIKGARELAQQLLRMSPNSPLAQELAGVVELQSDSLVQAESLLAKAVQAAPELAVARRGLVSTYLRTGQLDKALATLPDDIDRNDTDPLLVSLAGQVYMQKGQFAKAQGFFARAAKLDPKDASKRTSLALSRLMASGGNEGLNELQDIASGDAGTVADLALINAHMARRDTAKALKAIEAFEKKQPKD